MKIKFRHTQNVGAGMSTTAKECKDIAQLTKCSCIVNSSLFSILLMSVPQSVLAKLEVK